MGMGRLSYYPLLKRESALPTVLSPCWPITFSIMCPHLVVSVSRVGSLVTSTTHISLPEHRPVTTCVASLRGWQALRCKPGVNFEFMISIEKIQK